jgi:SAM-dependent methyltransferase
MRGPVPTAPRAGPARRMARRALLRLSRPFAAHQREVDDAIGWALQDLDRRLRELEAHDLDRRLRELEAEQLPTLGADLVEALERLRARVADAEEVVAGSRVVPYTSGGVLERFRTPHAGVVLGFRAGAPPAGEAAYREFEEVFRGPEDRVAERQRGYVALLADHGPVLDVGCGRGELLDLLRQAGTEARGVDADPGMVERCREKGLEVQLGDAGEHLAELPDGSLGGVASAQLVEHIPYPELQRFLELSVRKLQPGGIFLAETVNPHAPHALKTFWVDPTHQHPLFPETLLVLCRLAGFATAYAFHPLGSGHVDDDRGRESEYAVVASR